MMPQHRLVPRPISPEELAAAMRAGLDARRSLLAVSPEAAAVRSQLAFELLWPLSGLAGHPAPPAASPAKKVIRLLRRIVRKMVAPWLELQTRFNHTLLSELQALDLPGRDRALADVIHRFEALQDRVNECHYRLESFLARPPALGPSDPQAEAAESVFLQTRMPEPPGHALVLSGSPAAIGMLRDIGYTIVHAPVAEVRDLPLQPGSFRVILALRSAETGRAAIWTPGGAAARAATARLLAPNGRIFGSDCNAHLTSIGVGSQASAPLRILDQAVDGGIAVWAAAA